LILLALAARTGVHVRTPDNSRLGDDFTGRNGDAGGSGGGAAVAAECNLAGERFALAVRHMPPPFRTPRFL